MQQTTVRTTMTKRLPGLRLGHNQRKVLEVIESLGVCHNKQIARCLGWEINRITGRVRELYELGHIVQAGFIRSSETNRRVTLWKLANTP